MADEQVIIDIQVNADDIKDAEKAVDKLTLSISKLEEETKKVKKENKENAKIQDDLNKKYVAGTISKKEHAEASKKLGEITKQNNILIAKNTIELGNLKRERTANLKLINSEVGAYDQLSQKLNLARKAAKDIGAVFGTSSKKFKDAQKEVVKLDKALKDIDSNLGQSQRSVGAYTKGIDQAKISSKGFGASLKNLAGSLSNLVGGLGITAAISAFVGIVKNGIGIVINFEKAVSKMAAVSAKSKEELAPLIALIKELGATTEHTATQVTEAATALFQAGFNMEEVSQSLGATLDLATVASIDLGEAADLASNILGGFGLKASDLTMVVDLMSKSASIANVTVSSMAESFKEIASTAQLTKIPIEEVGALINLLGGVGIKGSDATNTVTTSLSRLAKPTKAAAKAIKELGLDLFDTTGELTGTKGQFVGITQTVEQLEKSFVGLTDQQKLSNIATVFGATSMKQWGSALLGTKDVIIKELHPATKELLGVTDEMGTVTFKSSELLKLFASELQNAEGSAKKMAKTMLDNLAGDMKIATSAWEGFVLSLEDGEGTINKVLRGFVKFGTAILTSLSEGNALTKTFGYLFDAIKPLGVAFANIAELLGLTTDKASLVDTIFDILSVTLKVALAPFRAVLFVVTKLAEMFGFFIGIAKDVGISIAEFVTQFEFANIVIDKIAVVFGFLRDKIVSLLKALDLMDDEQDKAIVKLDTRAKEEEKLAKKLEDQKKKELADEKKKNAELAKMAAQNREKRKKEADKQAADKEKAAQKEADRIKKENEKRIAEEEKRLEKEKDAAFKLSQFKLKLAAEEETNAQAKADKLIEIETNKLNKQLENENLTKSERKLLELQSFIEIQKIKDEFALLEKEKEEQKTKEDEEKRIKQLEILRETLENTTAVVEEFAGTQSAIFGKIGLAIVTAFEDGKISIESALAGIGIASNAVFSAIDANRTKDLESLQAQKARELEIAGEDEAAKAEIEAKFAEKEKAIKLKQWKADKASALSQVAIQTAIAVAKVWGQTGIGGLIAQAAPIAVGLLQSGVILAQKPPEFGDGTDDIVRIGGSHASGNDVTVVGYDNSGRSQLLGKVEKGERMPVIPKSQVNHQALSGFNSKFAPIKDRIFADGTDDILSGQSSQSQPEGINTTEIADAIKELNIFVSVEDISTMLGKKAEVTDNGII